MKHRTGFFAVLDPDLASMRFNQAFTNRQAQAGAAATVAALVFKLPESFEYVLGGL